MRGSSSSTRSRFRCQFLVEVPDEELRDAIFRAMAPELREAGLEARVEGNSIVVSFSDDRLSRVRAMYTSLTRLIHSLYGLMESLGIAEG